VLLAQRGHANILTYPWAMYVAAVNAAMEAAKAANGKG